MTPIKEENGSPKGLEGDPGTCIPTQVTVLGCFGTLDSCACPINTKQDCRYQLSIIDVYINNKTDQRLHLSSCKLLPVTVPSFLEEEEEEEDLISAFKTVVPELVSEWVTNPISSDPHIGPPPNVIEIGDTAFMRAAVSCYQNCCQSKVTFSIELAYTIGVKAKKLGLISATVARIKPPTEGNCKHECQKGNDAKTDVFLKKGFGELMPTIPVSISPPTQVYEVSGKITHSQFVIKVFGGTVVNGGGCTGTGRGSCEVDQLCVNEICMKGCTGNSGCPSGQVCSNNLCVSSTDGLPTKKLLIIITVAVTALVLVVGFLYFLLTLSNPSKKTT